MLENCKDARERWGGVSTIIDHWLDERASLIRILMDIRHTKVGEELDERLGEFCQLLVDYLSSGHFEVYQQLVAEGEAFSDSQLAEAQSLLPKIQISTDLALDFNDRFSDLPAATVEDIRYFSDQVSKLGEALADRFELEDQMIAMLHDTHREAVS